VRFNSTLPVTALVGASVMLCSGFVHPKRFSLLSGVVQFLCNGFTESTASIVYDGDALIHWLSVGGLLRSNYESVCFSVLNSGRITGLS
jgi:hypothetical protein